MYDGATELQTFSYNTKKFKVVGHLKQGNLGVIAAHCAHSELVSRGVDEGRLPVGGDRDQDHQASHGGCH